MYHPQTLAVGGELGKDWRALTSNSAIKMLAMRGLMGDPIAAPCVCW